MESKLMSKFIKYNKDNNDDMIEVIFNKIKRKGLPLIEKVNDGYVITFIQIGYDMSNLAVVGSFPGFDIKNQKLEMVSNTNIWYKTYKIEQPINFTYGYVKVTDNVNGNFMDNIILDRYNPNDITIYQSEKVILNLSVINMVENKKVEKYFKKNFNDINLKQKYIESIILDQKRRYWILKNNTNKVYDGVILFTDGFTYGKDKELLKAYNYIRKNKLIPNLLFVFIENIDRNKELTANSKFRDFIVDELYMKLKKDHNLIDNNDHNIICGKSLGGLNALYTSINTDIFSKMISQSGTFIWDYQDDKDKRFLINKVMESKFLPKDIYIDVGILEDDIVPTWNMSLIDVNKRLRDILKEKTDNVYFNIFQGGHDYYCWRKNTVEALLKLYN